MNKERMNKERTSTFARRAFSVTGPLVVVEFAAGLPERPGSWQRQFLYFLQAPKEVYVRVVLVHTAH